jgi:O-antigen/teichoic acid export membrane protein
MSVKLNLLKNTGASIWAKISVMLFRLIHVPLLLNSLGVEDLGRWFVLSTLPSWLMLSNLGFGNVASNEMSMSVAAGDIRKARSVFSTTLALVIAIGLIGTVLIGAIAPLIPLENFLRLPYERHTELVMTLVWFAISVFISFLGETFSARFRAARKAHISSLFYSLLPWLDLLAIFVALQFSVRFDHIALSLLCSNLIYVLLISWFSFRAMPALSFSFAEINLSHFKSLFRKGLAFLAFPLGNAFLFQGTLLIVEFILGPAAVAIFGTARTLVRTINQGFELINQVTWPEFSHLLGSKDMIRAAKLHRAGVGLSLLISGLGITVLALFGQTLYQWWVGKSLELPQHLLLLFLLPIIFNSLWFTSSVVHAASNQHEGLAIRYLIAATLSAVCCVILSYVQGIEGAALSTVIVDIILIPYVLKRSLNLTGDTWDKFLNGVLHEIRTMPAVLIKKFS